MKTLNKIALYDEMDNLDFKIMINRFRRIINHLGIVLGWGPGRQEYARRNIQIENNKITVQVVNYQGLIKIDDMHIILPSKDSGEVWFIVSDTECSADQHVIFKDNELNSYEYFKDDMELAEELVEFIEDYVSSHLQ